MRGHFRIMRPVNGITPFVETLGAFYADSESTLLAELAGRIAAWPPNASLVPIDEEALTIALRASVRRGAR